MRSGFFGRTASKFPTLAASDPYFSSVVALLHFDGADGSTTFTDNSGTPKTSAASGNAKLSTTWSKFGSASAVFDGNGDYIRITSGATDFTFGTGDFTIEMTIRPIVVPVGGSAYLYDSRNPSGSNCPQLRIDSTGKVNFLNSGTSLVTGTTTLVAGSEYVIAVARAGTSLRLFVNGTQEGGTVTNSTNFAVEDSAVPLTLGVVTFNPAFAPYNGYMDELRITKGVARYTANYTPDTSAFPNS